jgi:dTDP-4-dehydrorhamnose reductase
MTVTSAVEQVGEHRTILVFGTGRPLADRLAYYLRHYAEERNKAVTVIQAAAGDVNDMEWVQGQIWGFYTTEKGTQRPTLVINAHYSDDIRRLETSVEYAFRTNTHSAANIAIAARSAEIPLVQISTDQVFRCDRGPYESTDEPMPINMFGVSMVFAERAVAALYPAGTSVIRLSSLYGKENLTLGEHPDAERDMRFHPTFIGEAAFLISRNIIESPQMLALNRAIHCVTISEPISWFQLFDDAGKQPTPIKSFGGPRIGREGGLIPTKGWVLPQDYQKGFNEYLHEVEHKNFVSYW